MLFRYAARTLLGARCPPRCIADQLLSRESEQLAVRSKPVRCFTSTSGAFLHKERKEEEQEEALLAQAGIKSDVGEVTAKSNTKARKEVFHPRKSDETDVYAEGVNALRSSLKQFRKDLAAGISTELQTLIVTDVAAPHKGRIRIIYLNRGHARNALSTQMVEELNAQADAIHAEGASGLTRCVILASSETSAFCAGADLKERKGMDRAGVEAFLKKLRSTFTKIAHLPVPCLASVCGTALGGGLELALCAHIRHFASNAIVGLPETGLGIIPGAGGTYRLPEVVGQAKALEMILTRQKYTAAEAALMGLGLYERSYDRMEKSMRLSKDGIREACLMRTLSMARHVCQGGPLANRAVLQAMIRKERPRGEIEENMAYESLLDTEDRKEALLAFQEKRLPSFKGQ